MKVFLKTKTGEYEATGEYNLETKHLVVYKGAKLSKTISTSYKFAGADAIKKAREGRVESSILLEDVEFTSASTAGNFVTGRSTNGLLAWKTEDGRYLKELLS